MSARANIKVFGYVQGVGFRWFVKDVVSRTSLKGWVRNNLDFSVEIEVEGEKDEIEILMKEVEHGSRFSDVKEVKTEWLDFQNEFKSFEVTYV